MKSAYHFHFVDAYEDVQGEVEALDVAHAAILVLKQCGTEPARPRCGRYGIKVRDLEQAPREAELVVFDRFPNEVYRLEIRKVGTKKRKPLQLYA
jgi:hypothetical protein